MAQQVGQVAAMRETQAPLHQKYVVLTRSVDGHPAGTVGFVVEATAHADQVGVEVDRASSWPQIVYANCHDLRVLG